MTFDFQKYQGAGNDFILIDDRKHLFPENDRQRIEQLCNRRFGIGADGLMLLRDKADYDFEMIYFNADGKPGSMCGNGGRCIARFAADNNVITGKQTHFLAVDGPHDAVLNDGTIKLQMNDVTAIETGSDYFFLNTGSPHFVQYVVNLNDLDVYSAGKAIRYNDRFAAEGTNVNFVEYKNGRLSVRTYERGVEDETLACGTGITAVALTAALKGIADNGSCEIQARGGLLRVYFTQQNNHTFTNIWLEGEARFVFKGTFEL